MSGADASGARLALDALCDAAIAYRDDTDPADCPVTHDAAAALAVCCVRALSDRRMSAPETAGQDAATGNVLYPPLESEECPLCLRNATPAPPSQAAAMPGKPEHYTEYGRVEWNGPPLTMLAPALALWERLQAVTAERDDNAARIQMLRKGVADDDLTRGRFLTLVEERNEARNEASRLRDLTETLRRQAEQQAQEMRTQRSIVRECYQAATGATGEPGDHNGARPVIEEFARLREQVAALTAARGEPVGEAQPQSSDDLRCENCGRGVDDCPGAMPFPGDCTALREALRERFAPPAQAVAATWTLKRRKDDEYPIWLVAACTGPPGLGFTADDAKHLGLDVLMGDSKQRELEVRVRDAKGGA